MYKKIEGYNNYEVSDEGQVRNIKTGRILKPYSQTNYGHLKVTLSENRKQKTFLIHRLVLETFVGPCPSGMECCHNNGIASDNRLKNLRWDTHRSNGQDMIKHGTYFKSMGSQNSQAKLTVKQIKEIRKKYIYRSKNANTYALAKAYGVGKSEIWDIVNNKKWKQL